MHGQTHDLEYLDNPLSGVSTPGSTLQSAIRPDITSWALLAAVPTLGALLPVILEWNESSSNLLRTTLLQAGTDATDTPNGVQRPTDYNAITNARVWYQLGNAG